MCRNTIELEPKDEYVYMLINSDISNENAIKLLNLINDSVLIEKIDSNKNEVIEELLNIKLSNENIQYIFDNFDLFKT